MWHRVFCRSAAEVSAADLLAGLGDRGLTVAGHFRGDDLGWTAAEFVLGPGTPVYAERFLTDTDDLRSELNAWAAYLETLDYSTNSAGLMERVIQSRQLITIRKPVGHANEALVDRACQALCQSLAARADGVYQVEDVGWYAADGSLLVQEY